MSVVPIKSLLSKPLTTESYNTIKPGFAKNQKEVKEVLLSKSHLSTLWIKMTAMYGQLFLSKHGVEDNGVWFESLYDLTPKALEKGVERLLNLNQEGKFCEFPPNCMQFRSLCLDFYNNELNLPKAPEAYREIMNSAYIRNDCWSHEVVKFTALKLGPEFFKIEHEGSSYPLFKEAYEKVCNLLKQGHELPKITKTITLPKPASIDIANKHLTKMRQLLGVA